MRTPLMEDRRKNHRLCVLTRILRNDDQALSRAYDEIIDDN